MIRLILATLLLLFGSPALAQSPLIIAHRGASGERPEHTRMAYARAIEQGADFIEPDLVMSRDGVLIVRHENEIGGTTDVAWRPEFADRRTTRIIDGQSVTGWFTEDFTWAELQTLSARERLPDLRPANTAFDDVEPILSFEQVLEIARDASARTGRIIGVVPELKHPSYFASVGLPMEDVFVSVLERHGLAGAEAPVIVQCFEVGTLRRLDARIETPLLQLIAASGGPADDPGLSYYAMITPHGLAEIVGYAEWIGVDTALIEPEPSAPTTWVADAHAAGLTVAAWTVRAENACMPVSDRIGSDPAAHGRLREPRARVTAYGLEAVFMDQPGLGGSRD